MQDYLLTELVSSKANICRYQSFSNMGKNTIFLENKFKFTKQLENGMDSFVTHVKRCTSNQRYDQEDVIAGTICSELILVRDGHYQYLLTRSECIHLIEMLCTH